MPREFLLLERLGGDVATSIPGRIDLEKGGEEYFMLMVLWFEIYEERCLQCSHCDGCSRLEAAVI